MEDEVITILLQTDAQSEAAVRATAQETRGLLIAESTGDLDARSDLDALLTEDWASVERYGGLPPRSTAEVILDLTTGEHVNVYETAIARYDARRAAHPSAVPWIVSLPHFAPTAHAPDALTAMVVAPGSVPRPLRNEEVDYARFLNALETMERHNGAGVNPPIQQVGLRVPTLSKNPQILLGLLRALDTYRSRLLAGDYGPAPTE
jgi:hypothetical protein